MPYEPLEEKRPYQHAEEFADRVWALVLGWDWFTKKVCGAQFASAADSIGANIAEAGGRFYPNDVKNFLYHARGSLRESKYWLRRAEKRQMVNAEICIELDGKLESLSRELNEAIRFQKERAAAGTTSPPHHHTTSPP
jgi:four helix bundle protein